MSPLISIIIPIYNRADIIGGAIESCLAQTYRPIEVVLVDDCSSDGLSEALLPYQGDERIRLVKHASNQGVSAARNSGVEAAKGHFVAFLDSDDLWRPTKLEAQMALIEAQQGERFLCATLTEVQSDKGAVRVRPKRRKPLGVPIGDYLFVHKVQRTLPLVRYQEASLKGGCFAQTSSYLLPRSLAQATPFRTALNQYEDMAFLVDLDAKSIDFLLVEEALTIQHDDHRPGRLGARDDLARGYAFLEEIGDTVSLDAKLAFEATHLAHLHGRDHPIKVLKIVISAFWRRAISPRSVVGILGRSFLGQAGQRALRDTIMTWWWRPKNRGAV